MCMHRWVNENVSAWVSEWVSEWVGGWVSEWVIEWLSEWVSGWVSEWECEWVMWAGPFPAPLKSFKTPKSSQQLCHETSRGAMLGFEAAIWHFRGATTCFYCASKLPSGTFSAPLCFCWPSKLLSGTSEAPQPVSIGLWNCHLARFQHPLKALKASKPS